MSHFNVAFSPNVFGVSAVKQTIKADHEGTSAIKCGIREFPPITKMTMIHLLQMQLYRNLN